MASTPSASALSAVLRCRGNIWTRNPPTKRPATSVYSLGLAGGAVRDSPAERSRSNQTSAREAFLRGERVVVGRRLTVAYKSHGVDGLSGALIMRHNISGANGMRQASEKMSCRQMDKPTAPLTSPPVLDKGSQRTDLTERVQGLSTKIHTVI